MLRHVSESCCAVFRSSDLLPVTILYRLHCSLWVVQVLHAELVELIRGVPSTERSAGKIPNDATEIDIANIVVRCSDESDSLVAHVRE